MGYSIGFDEKWNRDIGYGVPAYCDHPGCNEEINRGLSCVCGNDIRGGEHGCGLYFCPKHLFYHRRSILCERCGKKKEPFDPKPEHPTWAHWKLTDESWQEWRNENPEEVKKLTEILSSHDQT